MNELNRNMTAPPSPHTGHHYKPSAIAAIACAYALAASPLNVMPLIVSAIMIGFDIGETTAGAITTIELLAMSITAFVLAPWGPRLVGRRLFYIAVTLAVTAHGLTVLSIHQDSFILFRVIAGFAAGLLLLGLNTRVASSHDPVRLYGIATITQTMVGMFLFMILPNITHQYGYPGLFTVLAILGLIILPIQWFSPTDKPSAQSLSSSHQRLSLALITMMAFAIFIIQASQSSYYAFVITMASKHQISSDALGNLLFLAYLVGIIGSAIATWLSERWGNQLPLAIGLGGHALAIILACYSNDPSLFYIAVITQTFFYFFVVPYQLGLAAILDPSGRLANIAGAMFFLGFACGPIIGGWLIEGWGYQAVAFFVIVTVLIGVSVYAKLIQNHDKVNYAESYAPS